MPVVNVALVVKRSADPECGASPARRDTVPRRRHIGVTARGVGLRSATPHRCHRWPATGKHRYPGHRRERHCSDHEWRDTPAVYTHCVRCAKSLGTNGGLRALRAGRRDADLSVAGLARLALGARVLLRAAGAAGGMARSAAKAEARRNTSLSDLGAACTSRWMRGNFFPSTALRPTRLPSKTTTPVDDTLSDLPEEESRPRDPVLDLAIARLRTFFDAAPERLFYSTQIETSLEREYFHWITGRGLLELAEAQALQRRPTMVANNLVNFYAHNRHRHHERELKKMVALLERVFDPEFALAIGRQGELMFDAALGRAGSEPRRRTPTRGTERPGSPQIIISTGSTPATAWPTARK